jgi:hypothetical protein
MASFYKNVFSVPSAKTPENLKLQDLDNSASIVGVLAQEKNADVAASLAVGTLNQYAQRPAEHLAAAGVEYMENVWESSFGDEIMAALAYVRSIYGHDMREVKSGYLRTTASITRKLPYTTVLVGKDKFAEDEFVAQFDAAARNIFSAEMFNQDAVASKWLQQRTLLTERAQMRMPDFAQMRNVVTAMCAYCMFYEPRAAWNNFRSYVNGGADGLVKLPTQYSTALQIKYLQALADVLLFVHLLQLNLQEGVQQSSASAFGQEAISPELKIDLLDAVAFPDEKIAQREEQQGLFVQQQQQRSKRYVELKAPWPRRVYEDKNFDDMWRLPALLSEDDARSASVDHLRDYYFPQTRQQIVVATQSRSRSGRPALAAPGGVQVVFIYIESSERDARDLQRLVQGSARSLETSASQVFVLSSTSRSPEFAQMGPVKVVVFSRDAQIILNAARNTPPRSSLFFLVQSGKQVQSSSLAAASYTVFDLSNPTDALNRLAAFLALRLQ